MAPIVINHTDGHFVVGGPAEIIRPALNGAAPITITDQRAGGDTVWLAPIKRQVWRDDAVSVDTTSIARTITHPKHGEIVYAYIDMDRLDEAPQVAALDARARARSMAGYAASMTRARAMVPDCDNCGDCPKCC